MVASRPCSALLSLAIVLASCGKKSADKAADEAQQAGEREARVDDEVRNAVAREVRMDPATRAKLRVNTVGAWSRATEGRIAWVLCRKAGTWVVLSAGSPGGAAGAADASGCDEARPMSIDVP